MKKNLTPEAGFRISHKVKFAFLLVVLGYLFWSLKPYSQLQLSKERIEMEGIVSAGTTIYLYERESPDEYQRGDIIYFSEKNGSTRLAWVAGESGDSLELKGNALKGNDLTFDLKGVPEHMNKSYPPVPPKHLFLVHRDQTLSLRDSLTEGPYPLENLNIIGKLFFHFEEEEKPISSEIIPSTSK